MMTAEGNARIYNFLFLLEAKLRETITISRDLRDEIKQQYIDSEIKKTGEAINGHLNRRI